jgi:hypothetical protein
MRERRSKRRPETVVDRAVGKVGGPTEASWICRVSFAAIYKWRRQGFINDGLAAVRLAQASGFPVEDLVGFTANGETAGPERGGRRTKGDPVKSHCLAEAEAPSPVASEALEAAPSEVQATQKLKQAA